MKKAHVLVFVMGFIVQGIGLSMLHADESLKDMGLKFEKKIKHESEGFFGVQEPSVASAHATTVPYRKALQLASDQLLVAKGLTVSYLTRNAADWTDMMALYPAAAPTHLISCVEGGREVIRKMVDGSDKYNPSVQRIGLKTGQVETILRGMHRCDGIRTTPWGTVLVSEETSTGFAFEILDPLHVSEETVLNRGAAGSPAKVTKPSYIAKREWLPSMAWEGLTVLESGVVIAGDELRPGKVALDSEGGSIFKFVPAELRTSNALLESLDASPLVSGKTYALKVNCKANGKRWSRSCERGVGHWIEVRASKARVDAYQKGATGFYRPEDLHRDPLFDGEGVRFCWANTGNKRIAHYGEVLCGVDAEPNSALSKVRVHRFAEGDKDFNAFDNLAFNPRTGQLYVLEDHPNGDIFACLPDGEDMDVRSDGCARIASVKDSSAEPTGFLFLSDGASAIVSIQHSNDANMPLVDAYPTDDVLIISGFARQ